MRPVASLLVLALLATLASAQQLTDNLNNGCLIVGSDWPLCSAWAGAPLDPTLNGDAMNTLFFRPSGSSASLANTFHDRFRTWIRANETSLSGDGKPTFAAWMRTNLGCSNYNAAKLQYVMSYMCMKMVDLSKTKCQAVVASTKVSIKPLCASTCKTFASSFQSIVGDTGLCPGANQGRTPTAKTFTDSCNANNGVIGPFSGTTGNCIANDNTDSSSVTCGFVDKSSICNSSLCPGASSSATCNPLANSPASPQPSGSIGSPANANPSASASTAADAGVVTSSSSGLSSGALIGIGGGVGLVVIAAGLFMVMRSRRNRNAAAGATLGRDQWAQKPQMGMDGGSNGGNGAPRVAPLPAPGNSGKVPLSPMGFGNAPPSAPGSAVGWNPNQGQQQQQQQQMQGGYPAAPSPPQSMVMFDRYGQPMNPQQQQPPMPMSPSAGQQQFGGPQPYGGVPMGQQQQQQQQQYGAVPIPMGPPQQQQSRDLGGMSSQPGSTVGSAVGSSASGKPPLAPPTLPPLPPTGDMGMADKQAKANKRVSSMMVVQQQQSAEAAREGDAEDEEMLAEFEGEQNKATRNYDPTMSDEMELVVGDMVSVTQKYDDGWGYGLNLSTGQLGVFPLNFVSPVQEREDPTAVPTRQSMYGDQTRLSLYRRTINMDDMQDDDAADFDPNRATAVPADPSSINALMAVLEKISADEHGGQPAADFKDPGKRATMEFKASQLPPTVRDSIVSAAADPSGNRFSFSALMSVLDDPQLQHHQSVYLDKKAGNRDTLYTTYSFYEEMPPSNHGSAVGGAPQLPAVPSGYTSGYEGAAGGEQAKQRPMSTLSDLDRWEDQLQGDSREMQAELAKLRQGDRRY